MAVRVDKSRLTPHAVVSIIPCKISSTLLHCLWLDVEVVVGECTLRRVSSFCPQCRPIRGPCLTNSEEFRFNCPIAVRFHTRLPPTRQPAADPALFARRADELLTDFMSTENCNEDAGLSSQLRNSAAMKPAACSKIPRIPESASLASFPGVQSKNQPSPLRLSMALRLDSRGQTHFR